METSHAFEFEDPDDAPRLSAMPDGVPVAEPRFRRAMLLLVLLSVPLWAIVIGVGIAIVRWLG